MSPRRSPYFNRELSWLAFNARVLDLAADQHLPLLERAKFFAIFSSNLDEFFQVRIAALRDQVALGSVAKSPDGLTASAQLEAIGAALTPMLARQESLVTDELLPELTRHGISLVDWATLGVDDRKHLIGVYETRIFPVLTPLAVDPSHPFPYISNLSLNLAVLVTNPGSGEQRFARVKVPALFPRLAQVPGRSVFVPVEQVIAAQLPTLFPGMAIDGWWPFRVTRNVDLTVDDGDADDLLAAVEMELRRARFGRAVRLEIAQHMPEAVLRLLTDELDLAEGDISRHHAPLDLTLLRQLHDLDRPELKDRPWRTMTAARMARADAAGRSVFATVRERDLLLHHPYESFASSVEEFIAQAADDPAVLSIKITLYRTSGDSEIANSLIRAAERGVQVAALVELRARFDEATNVEWAKALERAGVHVVYGITGLKTHAKCALVVRADDDGLRRYVHLSTGNYNARTAKVYEDIGYLTCDPDIGADATQLFNHLTGFAVAQPYRSLLVGPDALRTQLLDLIEREAAHGTDGRITMKMNSLGDPAMIQALYKASRAGVRVDLVVRGICCLRPGVAGMSETISVRSVLGRYLEHSRLYRFDHGSVDGQPLHLIGSADLMVRNLDHRVEALVPLTHPRHQEWLDAVFEFDLSDEVGRWELDADGRWTHRGGPADAQARLQRWIEARPR